MIDLRCGFRYFLYILMQLYMVVSFELQAGVFATRSALFLSDHRRRVSYIYIYIYILMLSKSSAKAIWDLCRPASFETSWSRFFVQCKLLLWEWNRTSMQLRGTPHELRSWIVDHDEYVSDTARLWVSRVFVWAGQAHDQDCAWWVATNQSKNYVEHI